MEKGKREEDVLRTRITIIGISFRLALCDFEIALVGHLVEGVFAAAEEFAGVAVAVGKGGGWLAGFVVS